MWVAQLTDIAALRKTIWKASVVAHVASERSFLTTSLLGLFAQMRKPWAPVAPLRALPQLPNFSYPSHAIWPHIGICQCQRRY